MNKPPFEIVNSLRYLLFACLTILLLYVGKTLFIPLFYGLFIAIIVYPVCKWLEKNHFSRAMAVTVSLSLLIVIFIFFVWIVALQVNAFMEDFPVLKEKVNPAIADVKRWLDSNMHISSARLDEWWANLSERITDNPGTVLAGSLHAITSGLFTFFIIPVFAALFLYNRSDFVLFIEKLAGDKLNVQVHVVLDKTMNTYFHFIKGMIWVYAIVGLLNSIGLLALGIRHAFLFGFLTAIMTIIPYIGIFISALLPITVAWITKDSIWYPVAVAGVFIFVQYLEANIIFPKVVAAELNVSTWATLVAIIAGGILWGMSGMILFIPLTGIFKMITDYIPAWEPLNILLRRTSRK